MRGNVNGEQDGQIALRKKKRKKAAIITAGIVVVIGSLALAIIASWDKWFKDEKEVVLPPIDPKAVEWTEELPYDPSSIGSDEIAIPGFKSMTVAANSKDVEVSFVNPESNSCYFVFRLALVDGERQEVLYESGLVEPGKGLNNIELSRELKPGLYDAKLYYDAYDIETKAPLNGAVLDFDLYAQ